jgi:hypothetical protein
MKRVSFAEKMLSRPQPSPAIIFTDESMIFANQITGHIWRVPGCYRDDLAVSTTAHPYKRMVWAAIGPNFKSELIFIDGYIDSNAYVNLLIDTRIYEILEGMFGKYGYTFQQDNAKPHTSRATLEALNELDIPLLEVWPPRSPDLSPIEMIWALLKSRCDLSSIRCPQDLDNALKEAWDSIDLETVNHYIDSFLARLTVCTQINGASLNGHWATVHDLHHQ